MRKRIVAGLLACITVLSVSPAAYSGVEPSPFKRFTRADYSNAVPVIISNLQTLSDTGIGTTDEVRARAQGVIETLQQNQELRHLTLIKRYAIVVMLGISGITGYPEAMRDESLRASAVGVLDRISSVAFNPQPEPPALIKKGLQLLDKITTRFFAPQPEPPRLVVLQVLALADKISMIAFNPQPEPPAKVMQALRLLDRVASISFGIEKKPMADDLAAQMLDAMELISAIQEQQ